MTCQPNHTRGAGAGDNSPPDMEPLPCGHLHWSRGADGLRHCLVMDCEMVEHPPGPPAPDEHGFVPEPPPCTCVPGSPDDGCAIHGFEAWQKEMQVKVDTWEEGYPHAVDE